MTDRMADDFMVVYRDILPGLNAPPEVRALFRAILVDWVNLDTLAGFEVNHEITDARSDAMEELADRIGMSLEVARERWPHPFEFEIE
jgi:hypothetical protein